MTCQEAVDLMGQAVEGELPSVFRPNFEEHMAECTPCATYLEHLRVTRDALRHLPTESATNQRYHELLEEFRREFGREARGRRTS